MAKPRIIQFKRKTARRLRQNTTDAESILWTHLRHLETRGTHFRRQVPIGNYVADFACLAVRLVIEVDGSQHGLAPNVEADATRTRWFESEGYRVIRFWNNDISGNIEGVMEVVYAALYGHRNAEPAALKHKRRSRGADD